MGRSRKSGSTPARALAIRPGVDPIPSPESVAWQVQEIDPLTGQPLEAVEIAYRQAIAEQHRRGLIAVDPLYEYIRAEMQKPLTGRGEVIDNTAWELRRNNRITLRIPFSEIADLGSGTDVADLDRLGVEIAHKALGPAAADVMDVLYTWANDPPNWRNPVLRISMNKLLDTLAYRHDRRGVHYSNNRRLVAQTLLALQFTRFSLQQQRGRTNVGTIATLISSLTYETSEPVGDLTPFEVWEQGLPELLTITLSREWYRTRDASGAPNPEFNKLIKRPLLPDPRSRTGRRSTVRATLEDYLMAARDRALHLETHDELVLTRNALLSAAKITDADRYNQTRTLRRNLEALRVSGVLQRYFPDPLPTSDNDLITLVYAPPPL